MEKIDSLQGLRAIGFLAIFISHANFGGMTSGMGAWGVSVFLVLSGFVMAINYVGSERRVDNAVSFAIKKIFKLYPLHIFMMCMCAIWECIHFGTELKRLFGEVVLHSLMIQIYIPDPRWYATLNGPSWYLAVCFLSY